MIDTIEKLKNTIYEVLNNNIDTIDWEYKPGPAKWSKKEIMGHLIDSAQINLQRFIRCTYEENFKLTYEQVEWVAAQHYQLAGVNELLSLWKFLNLQIARVLANYPPGRLLALCDNGKTTQSMHTVEWLAADYVIHMRHHLKQVFN